MGHPTKCVPALAGVDVDQLRLQCAGGEIENHLGHAPASRERGGSGLAGVPQLLVHGTADRIVPISQSERYAAAARIAGDEVEFLSIPGAGHFDLIEPSAPARIATAARLIDRLGGS